MEFRISSVCWLAAASAAGPFAFVGDGTTDPSAVCCGVTFKGLAFNNKPHSVLHHFNPDITALQILLQQSRVFRNSKHGSSNEKDIRIIILGCVYSANTMTELVKQNFLCNFVNSGLFLSVAGLQYAIVLWKHNLHFSISSFHGNKVLFNHINCHKLQQLKTVQWPSDITKKIYKNHVSWQKKISSSPYSR